MSGKARLREEGKDDPAQVCPALSMIGGGPTAAGFTAQAFVASTL